MVSPGEPKTIRLLEGGLVLRDGSIVDRPDERFVPRVRALQRRRCDRVRSVRVRPQQNVPEENVDAILEDLLDLSKAPMVEVRPVPPPAPEEPDVDEVAAERLFDSLLVEIQP